MKLYLPDDWFEDHLKSEINCDIGAINPNLINRGYEMKVNFYITNNKQDNQTISTGFVDLEELTGLSPEIFTTLNEDQKRRLVMRSFRESSGFSFGWEVEG